MQHTVGKWRRRYSESGLDGLLDEPRPGTSRKLGDADVERVLTLTLESAPRDATHWLTRSMAKRVGLSRNSIQRIWQAFSLAPHRSETFKLSRDPLFIDKVRDIVGLYLAPPERALVLCVDEKSQIQALDRTAPLLPMRPGQIERRTHGRDGAGFGGTRGEAVRYLSYAARQMQDDVRQRKTLLLGLCIAVLRRVLLSYTAPPNTPLSIRTPCARQSGHVYSSCPMISSSLGLCLALRPVRGLSATTRDGLGWPTRSRALALTALAAENRTGLRFPMARMSME